MQCSVSKVEKIITAMFKKANASKRVDLLAWWGEYSNAMENGKIGATDMIEEHKSSLSLTTEEKVVLGHLERGLTIDEITSKTKSTKSRIADLMEGLFSKANVKNRTELVRWWIDIDSGKSRKVSNQI
jgi:DNA-binding NarL/FixJ family response regulator